MKTAKTKPLFAYSMKGVKTYPVHERFSAFQGEGMHTGRSAYFIRLFGCPLHCPWCDSAGTWHKDYVPSSVNKMTINELLVEIRSRNPDIVVITGGEPTIHDLSPFKAIKAEFELHLETSGAFPITTEFDWITVSPKASKPCLEENYYKADEIKLIVEPTTDLKRALSLLDSMFNIRAKRTLVRLHPEWSQRRNSLVLDNISRTVVTSRSSYPFLDVRAGWQLHKNYQVDALDSQVAKSVPLGGNLNLGY